MKKDFKNAKTFAAMFALTVINLAIGATNFADAGTAAGTDGVKENLDAANQTPSYGFEDQLRSIIMKEIEASEQVSLGDAAVDHVNEMTEENPLYSLADSITAKFTGWFAENGISTETFETLPAPSAEGELLESNEGTETGAADQA